MKHYRGPLGLMLGLMGVEMKTRKNAWSRTILMFNRAP